MYDYRLEGHLKEAVVKEDSRTIERIVLSNILPRPRLAYYFHMAVQNGKLESVRSFLSARIVHVDHVNADFGADGKVTALHEAILLNRPTMIKFLLCAGASTEIEATFSFARATALELARMAQAPHIVKIIKQWKDWLCGEVQRSINYLTATREYVFVAGGRDILSGLAKTRVELLDELIEFFKTLRSHVNILQHQWKIVETIYERNDILSLIDSTMQCIQILIKYHKLTEVELRIYESRLKSKIQ